MDTLYRKSETMRGDIPASLAAMPGTRPSAQTRPIHPEAGDAPHPRAVEMAECVREARGSTGFCTFADLLGAGFTTAEVIEHEKVACALATSAYVRQVSPPGDRVPEIITKAIAAAAHVVPIMAGVETSEVSAKRWRRYCAARAAFKLDPWVSQGERCVHLLEFFLRDLPLLAREANRVLYAIAAEQKTDLVRIAR